MKRLAAPLVLLFGCAPVSGEERDAVGVVAQRISGGELDHEDPAVVAVEGGSLGLCSGVRIAPRLVLTARHCVAPLLETSEAGGVLCGTTRFGGPHAATAFHVTSAFDVRAPAVAWERVAAVHVPSDDAFCGNDVAVLELTLESTVPPLSVAEAPPSAGQTYGAVGYGATDESASEYGKRRRRDGLAVSCVGAACEQTSLDPREWLGPEGTCAGDSGGPALDASGRVLGVVSRSLAGCASIVYEAASARADWLDDVAEAVEAKADEPSIAAQGGCSVGVAKSGPDGARLWFAAAVCAISRSLSGLRSGRSPRRRCLRSSRRSTPRSAP